MIQLLQSEQDAKKLLNFSVKIAKSMLFYGAEVYRVEDTVNRIYKSFNNEIFSRFLSPKNTLLIAV